VTGASDPTWASYRQEAFGDPYLVWHDGPDFAVFQQNWERDPELATRMLVAGIAEGDALAAETVRELRLTPAQRSHFVATLLASSMLQHGGVRIAALRSLVELTGDPSHATGIAEELHIAAHWGDRLDAALALRDLAATPALVTDLATAVAGDPEYLVRYHAANTLLHWAGLPAEIESHDDLFALLTADESPEKWARVAADLAARVPATS